MSTTRCLPRSALRRSSLRRDSWSARVPDIIALPSALRPRPTGWTAVTAGTGSTRRVERERGRQRG
eukprot:scaffold41812_cov32-Tisochrysis_lutea.AAC.6